MARWEPWVRAATLDAELMSALGFGADSVAYVDHNGTPDAKPGFVVHDTTSGARKGLAAFIPPTQDQLLQQVPLVHGYADLRDDLAAEILAQMSPPFAFWGSVLHLQPERHRHTFELISLTLRLANYVEMRVKHALACPRPIEFSPDVQPIIQTPGHGSLPSGHATEAYAVATVLARLRSAPPETASMLDRQAARIATNRVVAGVHFPVDSVAGRLLGVTLGEYLVARSSGSDAQPVACTPRQFVGTLFNYDNDADLNAPLEAPRSATQAFGAPFGTPNNSLLGWLWQAAAREH